MDKAKTKELQVLVERLQLLRNLRREKAKRAGHFFPQEDDEFFEKVKEANEKLAQAQKDLSQKSLDFSKQRRAEARSRQVQVSGMSELEMFYAQARFDLENLIAIRQVRCANGFRLNAPPIDHE
jgi:hypothetical protein